MNYICVALLLMGCAQPKPDIRKEKSHTMMYNCNGTIRTLTYSKNMVMKPLPPYCVEVTKG
jgi:hypothetical protein